MADLVAACEKIEAERHNRDATVFALPMDLNQALAAVARIAAELDLLPWSDPLMGLDVREFPAYRMTLVGSAATLDRIGRSYDELERCRRVAYPKEAEDPYAGVPFPVPWVSGHP